MVRWIRLVAVSVPLVFVWLLLLRQILHRRQNHFTSNNNDDFPVLWFRNNPETCHLEPIAMTATSQERPVDIESLVKLCMAQGGEFWDKVKYLVRPRHLQFGTKETQEAWTVTQGSLVWIEDAGVYLVVLKLVYKRDPYSVPTPLFSVLVAQVYDKLENKAITKNITLNGNTVKFPKMLEVPVFVPPRIEWYLGVDAFHLLHLPLGEVILVYSTKFNYMEAKHFAITLDGAKRWSFHCTGYDDNEWTPITPITKDYVSFVSSWDPFTVIRCPLTELAPCTVVSSSNQVSTKFKGSLPFIPLSDNKWLGFGTSWCADCGCGTETLRPHMVTISETNGQFRVDGVLLPLQLGIAMKGSNRSDPHDICGTMGSHLTVTNIVQSNDQGLMVDYDIGGYSPGVAVIDIDTSLIPSADDFQEKGDIIQCAESLLLTFTKQFGDLVESQLNLNGQLWKLPYQQRKEAEAKETLRKQQVAAARQYQEFLEAEEEARRRLEAEMRWHEAQRYQTYN